MSKIYIIITLLLSVSLLTAQTTEGKYAIKNIRVNTELADFGASYFGADSVVFTAPRSKKPIIKNIWKPNSQPYLDLYVGSVGSDGEIIGKQKVKGVVNTKFHEAIVAFTKDLKAVYFTGNNYHDNIVTNDVEGVLKLQLFKASVQANGEWTNVEKLPFNRDHFSTGHPALSADGKKLYFISDRTESIGKTDIFVVDVNTDGTFSEPKNLGSEINTKGKEMFPFITDENILYFSSDGYHGNGGLDVFAVKLYDNSISEILNLGAPINSSNDDFAFILKKDRGYLSSNRSEGMGDDDIYSFRVLSPLKIECTQLVMGIVRNKDTQKVLAGTVVNLIDDSGNELNSVTTATDGMFNFYVACNMSYKIVGAKTDFIGDEKVIKATNDVVEEGIKVSLDLAPAKIKNKKININPIYFDLNKSNIRPDAAKELNKVIDLMLKNPDIIVESRSHTDSRGKDASNLSLSDRRAKSTVAYIVSKGGIDASRISGKGFGETDLLNDCTNFVKCSKAKHQMNRRTEFYIVDYKE